ncbi:hypothetical protein P175DRAFT_0554740 [Aspergillus ochraceoroseus IBT 24754]|uniref:Uncharacterized protein n=1 Tax=Aspergillus ochraceoroseus IBT 24754 TaxID=1392256 RepID=A0A2T5MAE9_9EURO|nr:uncharacterized protein P175DRAFT_0554740 [Aspergillus ochraceoroseus IBT 24754]PTU25504.1 hypothetical protein P175DRAFT_0554740 [Aspergillus ochraceoroseus IBT 24754]
MNCIYIRTALNKITGINLIQMPPAQDNAVQHSVATWSLTPTYSNSWTSSSSSRGPNSGGLVDVGDCVPQEPQIRASAPYTSYNLSHTLASMQVAASLGDQLHGYLVATPGRCPAPNSHLSPGASNPTPILSSTHPVAAPKVIK